MMHNSVVKLNSPIEFVEARAINPLISKCQIKVCYVGQEPNRNGSIISKAVATQMGTTLPGSPIIGFFSDDKQDFRDHSPEILISEDGEFSTKTRTRPYGFVDINAPVWFQTFIDDGIEHEYLMTEGYLWTGQYPEANSVIETGKGQSMELDVDRTRGYWSDDAEGQSFFIINEAYISALCLLGDDVEPCFEGASVEKPYIYSYSYQLKHDILDMTKKMKEILQEGDFSMEENKVETPEVNAEVEEEKAAEEVVEETPVVEEPILETVVEEPAAEVELGVSEVTYNLEEIPEYVELTSKYSELEDKFASLEKDHEVLQAELNAALEQNGALTQFKKEVERKDKQAMIDSFYMLSDEDKKDVVENIDNYSIDDIEAKLSIACVRNKVSFAAPEEAAPAETMTFSLNDVSENSIPAWIQAVNTVAKDMK